MKKLLLLIFLTAWAFPGFSQLGLGLRAGFGGSSTSQELVTGMNRTLKTGPTFGLIAMYDLDLHFAGGLEFNYSSWGETLKYSAAFSPEAEEEKRQAVATTVSINYLQIPILGRLNFGDKKYRLIGTFGPYIGIGMSGKWENGPRPRFRNSVISFDSTYSSVNFNTGDFKRIDLGGLLGVGGQYEVTKGGVIFAEARLMLGFMDFYNTMPKRIKDGFSGSQYQRPGASWRAANITVGYLHTFKLPKKSSNSVQKAGKQKRG